MNLSAIAALLVKDLRLLARDRGALFLTFAWPLVLSIFFGALGPGFGAALDDGGKSANATMTVLAVDRAQTATSEALLAEIDAEARIAIEALGPAGLDDAQARVQAGDVPAYILIEAEFGARPHPLLEPGAPAWTLTLGVDPRRRAEADFLTGATQLAAWRALARTLPGADESGAAGAAVVDIEHRSIETRADQADGPPSPYAVTFPQGIIWAVLACAATFAVSLVEERKRGTLMRLAVAPVSRMAILAGKAGACLVAIVIMQLVLVTVAVVGFGVRPQSPGLLVLALACTAFAFVGVMTLLAVLGRRTASAAGLSWAILMTMAMIGGGMLPLFLMPSWLQLAANASPVAWSLRAIEGAVWRGFGLAELALPCVALVVLGAACLLIGARSVRNLN